MTVPTPRAGDAIVVTIRTKHGAVYETMYVQSVQDGKVRCRHMNNWTKDLPLDGLKHDGPRHYTYEG